MSNIFIAFLIKLKKVIYIPYCKLIIQKANTQKNKIKKQKRNTKGKTIKVGFIVQMPEVWDKEAPVYEKMVIDKRFESYLIIVPHYDFVNDVYSEYGDEKLYFEKKYPKSKIIVLRNINDNPIDESFDYVFYQRCWESYLPKQLRCKNIINYAMTCYIPYCYHCAPEPNSYYQVEFFWYLSKFYCCSKDQHLQVTQIKNVESQYLGYPVIDSLVYPKIEHDSINVLWTPRWTDDPAVGGTSFNRNKNRILELTTISEKVNLILRPHPLTFENAIKQKWMTELEVEEYKQKVITVGAHFDDNKIIEETFINTDILVTDFTSAIITYFLSGRPIVYCSDSDFKMIDTFKDIIETLYIAKEWNDIKRIVMNLINGNDPLFAKRQEVIKKLGNNHSSVERIIDDLEKTIHR